MPRRGSGGYTLCRACGLRFTGTRAFDEHRTGSYDPDERRCRTPDELRALGASPDQEGRWSSLAPKRLLANQVIPQGVS